MAGKDKDTLETSGEGQGRVTVPTEAGDMHVEIRGDRILVDMPMEKRPRKSHSDQHHMIATTHGNVLTPLKVDGDNVSFNLNIFTIVKQ